MPIHCESTTEKRRSSPDLPGSGIRPSQRALRELFRGQPNLVLKLTLTPRSRALGFAGDPLAALRSVRTVPLQNIYFLVGPLVRDNRAGARQILEALPEGAWADVKALTGKGIPGMQDVPAASEEELAALRELAAQRGITMTDYYGCLWRRALGRPFYKTDDAPGYVRQACASCAQSWRCWTAPDPLQAEQTVIELGQSIGLDLRPAEHRGPRSFCFTCAEPSSRGDETYLAERTGYRVEISSTPAGSQGGSFCIEEQAVLQRWQRVGMFPAEQVRQLARRTWEALPAAVKEQLS